MTDMHGIVNHGFVPDCTIDIQEDKKTMITEETPAKENNELENENDKDTKIAENFIDNTDKSQHKEFKAQNETVLNDNNISNENNNVKSFIEFGETNISKEMSEAVKDEIIDLRDITSNDHIKVEDDKELAFKIKLDENIKVEEDEAFDLKDKPSNEYIKLEVDEALDLKEIPSTENLKFEENESLNFTENPSNDHMKLKDDKLLDLKGNLTNGHDEVDDLDVIHKYLKPLYKSFNEKHVRFLWGRTSSRSMFSGDRRPDGDLESNMKPSTPELSRSQYSLVSTGELTAEALQVWLGLPKKIKYDPELAPFRQHYEKEYGKSENVPLKAKNGPETKRLPLVKSAPHLNNNIRIAEDVYVEGKQDDVEIQNPRGNGAGLHCGSIPKKPSKFVVAKHYIKMTLLLACWVFFTLVFLMYNEKEEIFLNSSVNPGEVKLYMLNVTDSKLTVKVKLSGPFITEQAEEKMNSSEFLSVNKMVVWLEKIAMKDEVKTEDGEDVTEISKFWTIVLQDDDDLDFSKGERRSSIISLASNQTESNRTTDFALRMRTTASKTVPFTMSYTLNPLDLSTGVIYSCILLCGLYVLIIFEVINRTMAAVLISTTSLATLALVGERPTLPQLVSWLDMETLLLLFSMMLLVAIMAETGMFDFLAVFTFEVTKGKLWPLITLLCIITALLSTFLDNVTTVLLMTPVTIRLCEVMDLDPVPILMSMVLFSNIGGTATPVGDPPNVIIASNKNVIQAGINFTNFTMHMTLGILIVCVQTYFQLRFIYRDTNKLRLNVPRDIQDLRHQISIWRRAIESLPHLTKDQHVVRERLERKINKLNVQLETMIKESNKRVCPKDTFQSTLDELKQKYKIRDKMLLLKSTIAISFVVAVFFLHSIPELNRVSLGWTALLGAILLLTLADREDLEPILHRVEWSTLLFFASLFVLMEALSKLGLIEFIGGLTESLILRVDEKARLAVALLLMLWVSGVTSAFVDNIPLTTMMVRVVIALGSNPNLNLPMAPLVWALSFGACLGGNGTLIGASANVVCAGVAEQHGYRFTFMQFFKVGFPIMIGHLIVASGYLLLCHCVFTWH